MIDFFLKENAREDDIPAIQISKLRETIGNQVDLVWKASELAFEEALKIENESARHLELYKAKKGVVHCLRFLMYGIQIANKGKIHNFLICDTHTAHKIVRDYSMISWDDYSGYFLPFYQDLFAAFRGGN